MVKYFYKRIRGKFKYMILYHGTDSESAKNIIRSGIDLKHGDESVDNAQGFYMTPNYEFALQRAKNMTLRKTAFLNSPADGTSLFPAVLKIDFEFSEDRDLRVKMFMGVCSEWKQFVMFNRLGLRFLKKWSIESENHNLDFKYDVVCDETADSQIGHIVSLLRYSDDISELAELAQSVTVSDEENWDKQISIHTQRALKQCIKSVEIMPIENTRQEEGL